MSSEDFRNGEIPEVGAYEKAGVRVRTGKSLEM